MKNETTQDRILNVINALEPEFDLHCFIKGDGVNTDE
jgi:hypothetical protein